MRVSDEELEKDPCIPLLVHETEEGKKVTRLGGQKHWAVFRRLDPTELPPPQVNSLFNLEETSSS